MNIQMKIMLSVAEITELYLKDDGGDPWMVAWSGGKDSSTVLELVCRSLQVIPKEKRTRKVYAVMSDTMMENPELESYMHDQIRLVNEWAKSKDMPLEAMQVHREDKASFFYLLLGKGYPLPNNQNRWCTHRLKIIPQNAAILTIKPNLVFLGVRTDESTRRAASIERYRDTKESRFGTHYNFPEIPTYMPIVDYTITEIWDILQRPLQWGSSEPIRRLYREATGECAVTNPNGATELANACGARFGCWTCPPISKDKSTENMAEIHEWMKPLTVWRTSLIKAYKVGTNKCGYMRNGKHLGDGKGTLTIQARQILMQNLLDTEDKMNELRADKDLPPLKLISHLETELIRRQWEADARDGSWMIGS